MENSKLIEDYRKLKAVFEAGVVPGKHDFRSAVRSTEGDLDNNIYKLEIEHRFALPDCEWQIGIRGNLNTEEYLLNNLEPQVPLENLRVVLYDHENDEIGEYNSFQELAQAGIEYVRDIFRIVIDDDFPQFGKEDKEDLESILKDTNEDCGNLYAVVKACKQICGVLNPKGMPNYPRLSPYIFGDSSETAYASLEVK